MLWISMFLLGILGLAIALVTAELTARAWLRRQGFFVRKRWEHIRLTLDRDALPSLEPVVNIEINGEGERGDPLPTDRDGLYRVLVAGGSAAECGLLDQPSTWPAVMQELLNRPRSLSRLGAGRVHVGNVGRSMTPLEAVHDILKETLPRYDKLDLLVLMVGISDALDWLERRTPAELPESCAAPEGYFEENPRHRFAWSIKGLALKRLAGNVWRRVFRPVRERRNGGRRFVELRKRRNNSRRWVRTLPEATPVLDRIERYLRLTIDLAHAKGARVILVRQPWLDRVLKPEEEAVMWNFSWGRLCIEKEESAYYTHGAVRNLLQQVDRRLSRVASQLGVEQVDLMPVLEADLTHFYDFNHFTPEGARRTAEHTVAAVLGERKAAERLESVESLSATTA